MENDNALQLENLEENTNQGAVEGNIGDIKQKDEVKQKLKLKQYGLIGLAIGVASIVIISIIIGIVNGGKKPSNIAPYCALTHELGRTCIIHNEKHTVKELKKLTISPEEIEIQKELVNEIREGAYFDGKRLYRTEQGVEILAMRDAFEKEKKTLFERYLASNLTEEEQLKYNFLIEQLAVLEETISKLNIEEAAQEEITEEQLNKQVNEATAMIEQLTKEIEQLKAKGQVEVNAIDQATGEVSGSTIEEKAILEKELNIPKNIEQAGVIKRSVLYN